MKLVTKFTLAVSSLTLAVTGLAPAQAAPSAVKLGDIRFSGTSATLSNTAKATLTGWSSRLGEMDTVSVTSYVVKSSKVDESKKLGINRNGKIKVFLNSKGVSSEFRVKYTFVKKNSPLANLTRLTHVDRPESGSEEVSLHSATFNVTIPGTNDCDRFALYVKMMNATTYQTTYHYVPLTVSGGDCVGSRTLIDLLEATYTPVIELWNYDQVLNYYLSTEGWYQGSGGPGMAGYASETDVNLQDDITISLTFTPVPPPPAPRS